MSVRRYQTDATLNDGSERAHADEKKRNLKMFEFTKPTQLTLDPNRASGNKSHFEKQAGTYLSLDVNRLVLS